jgi:hypothetical protein
VHTTSETDNAAGWCFAYQGTAEQERPMTGHHAVHINVAPVPPGVVGIRRDWH